MKQKVRDAVKVAADRLTAAGINPATVDPNDPALVPYGITPEVARLIRKRGKLKARRRLGGRP